MCNAGADVREYELKAVYIERITRFLTWPEEGSEEQPADAFVIGILGENPFGGKLSDLYAGRSIKGKPISTRQLTGLDEVEQCHILFIARSEEERLSQVLTATRGRPILTVGDTEGFAQKGVLINLEVEGGKLVFVINQTTCHEAGILVNSLILKVARVVAPFKKTR